MKSARKWESTFPVGVYRVTIQITLDPKDRVADMKVMWAPHLPPQSLSDHERAQYRAGRDALNAEIGKALGGSILVIEVWET